MSDDDSPVNFENSLTHDSSTSSISPSSQSSAETVINAGKDGTPDNDGDADGDLNSISEKASELKEHDVLDEETAEAKKVEESLQKELEENDGWVRILGNDQLMKKVIKEGSSNKRPLRGELCKIRLEGRLNEQDFVFESYDSFSFQLGDAEVISGLDLSIPLMNLGELAHIKVASRFGYGSKGLDPLVPPNAELFYEVELLSFDNEKDLEELSVSERKAIGDTKRQRGNWWYSRGECSLAIQCYRRALEFLNTGEGSINYPEGEDEFKKEEDSELLKSLFDDRLTTYNNMAAAQMKVQAYEPALSSVESVLKCQPNNVKALFRKGKILGEKGEVAKALAILKEANQLEPKNKAILIELRELSNKRKEELKSEKQLYRRMFNDKVENAEGSNDKDGNSSFWFKKSQSVVVGGLVGGVIVGIVGVMAYRYRFI